jgi:hypothetical protein
LIVGEEKQGVDWIQAVKDSDRWWAFVNTVVNPGVPLEVDKFVTSRATISLSSRTLLHGVC